MSSRRRGGTPWLVFLALASFACELASAQTLQKGLDASRSGFRKLRFDYIAYRPAQYEDAQVTEPENERPNRGGLISVYYTNVSSKPVSLAFWRINRKDESHWRLGSSIAWDRESKKTLEAGESAVLEICGVTEDFAPGKPFEFAWVDRGSWLPAGSVKGTLATDPATISSLIVQPGLSDLVVHLRYEGTSPIALGGVEIVGQPPCTVEWRGGALDGPGHAVGKVHLGKPLASMQVFLVRVEIKNESGSRWIYSHRRAHPDRFPIGTWGAEEDRRVEIRRMHVDTCIHGGPPDDAFFGRDAARLGFHAIVPAHVDQLDGIRKLADHPAVSCLMLADEPDWSTAPNVLLFQDELVRRFNPHKPTFTTLCRNVKFFEYASIVDIPCMDHYSVTAPSSSKWPTFYGTRLEETGFYTRDLKRASEPKPVWVWSQGLFDWGQRPAQSVPTPDELAVQLWQNIGRGAKGILWFTLKESAGKRYPATKEEIRRQGRLLSLLGSRLLVSDPFDVRPEAPGKLDVAALAGPDAVVLALTNLDYDLHPKGYVWRPARNPTVSLGLPGWFAAGKVLRCSPEGIEERPMSRSGDRVVLEPGDIASWAVLVLVKDSAAADRLREEFARVQKDETREFEQP